MATFGRNPSVLWRRTFDGVLVLPPEGRRDPLLLEPPGDLIWSALEQPQSRDELIRRLSDEFPKESRERIHDDVEPFLDTLVEQGALWRQ